MMYYAIWGRKVTENSKKLGKKITFKQKKKTTDEKILCLIT